MSDPAWSQAFILQDGANFTFPNYQTCTHANTGSCQITALSAIKSTAGWTYYEVHCTVASSTTYIGVGFLAETIALQTTQNIRANPSQGSCSWVEDHSGGASGGVYNNGSEVLSGPNLPNPTFVIGVLVNGTEGIWGYTVDGTNWNGTNTAAQIVAGTGAITMGYAGPYLPFISAQDYEGSNVAFTASIYASSANCTYALPTGASYLAASPILTVSSATCLPGDAVQIDWTAANTPVPAGLNYLLDSGSPTACSGSVTGTAGTAIGPTLSSGFHSIAIQDPTSLSESNWTGFYVAAPPSGAGTLVYQSSGTSLSSVAVTFTVDLPIGFAFDFYMQAQSTSGTIQLTGGNDFILSAAGTITPDYATGGGFSNPDLPDYTPQNQNGWIGVAPATGPTYASVTTSTSVQGSVSLVDGEDGAGTLTATITNNGSVSTYSHVVENYAPFTLGSIDSSTIFPGHDTTYSYYLGVYTLGGPQTLTIDSAEYADSLLSFAGTNINTTLGTLNVSTNDGDTFEPVTSLSVTGTAYSATLAGYLSAGTYSLIAEDGSTLVLSNEFSLEVAPTTETLTIISATGTVGGIITANGLDYYGPAASLDIRAGGSWSTLQNYETSGGGTAMWNGLGPQIEVYGAVPVQVRVSSDHTVKSNIVQIYNKPPPPPPPPPFTPRLWPGAQFPSKSLALTLNSYLYEEYADDPDLQAFVAAYNKYTQAFLAWFNSLNLPVYTAGNITGALLDWVAAGLYGMQRPVLPSGTPRLIGPVNTYAVNAFPLNTRKLVSAGTVFVTTDDIFKRVITWHFYKGDGKTFTVQWLKRRIMRFLFGVNGTDFIIDQTLPISVTFGTRNQVVITLVNGQRIVTSGAIPNTFALNTMPPNRLNSVFKPVSTPTLGPIFKAAMNSGALELPFQFAFEVQL